MFYVFIYLHDSNTPDEKFRDIIFEVIVKTDLKDRFDRLHPFWDNFCVRDEIFLKKIGYYKIEHVGNPCKIVLAIIPKEYFQYFEKEKLNKKDKADKKGSSGMEFEDFSHRIHLLNEIGNFGKQTTEKQQYRFTVVNRNMKKNIFEDLNSRRLMTKGVTSPTVSFLFRFRTPSLKTLNEYKEKKGQKI